MGAAGYGSHAHIETHSTDEIGGAVVMLDAHAVEGIASANGRVPPNAPATLHVVTFEGFAAEDEPGAAAILGNEDNAAIPEGGDVMVYGDGGAGKTTLTLDVASHLAAGDDWNGIEVARPVKVLVIENEGPRPQLRRKVARKLAAWKGSPLEKRLLVLDEPWGEFTFANPAISAALAALIREQEIDVLIAGPLSRIGMDAAGTLQEVAAFMRLLAEVRRESGRRLTVIVVHHEGKSGSVSGAWEGAGDTLIHVEARGHGRTSVKFEKARWSSVHHGTTLNLKWTDDGEGFEVEDDARHVCAEIVRLLRARPWRTVKEIAAKRDHPTTPGIGAGEATVKAKLAERPDLFLTRKGSEVGRSGRAICYGLHSPQNAVDAVGAPAGTEGRNCTTASTVRDAVARSAVPSSPLGLPSPPDAVGGEVG